MFKKDDFLHSHPDPQLVKNMTGSFEQYNKDLRLAREEVELKMKVVNVATALETKAHANKLAKKLCRKALLEHQKKEKAKSEKPRKRSSDSTASKSFKKERFKSKHVKFFWYMINICI